MQPNLLTPEARQTLFVGSLFAFFAVALGAFGAHALKATLDANHTAEIYGTAAHYHLIHALAILILAALPIPDRTRRSLRLLFSFGILIFAGSLYLLALTNLRWLGAITPLGGLCFLSGWFTLAFAFRPGQSSLSA